MSSTLWKLVLAVVMIVTTAPAALADEAFL